MANTTSALLPATAVLLQHFGERLRLARLRRRLQAKQVAERAGMSVVTLRKVERGDSGVTMGAYLAVLQVLQLQKDMEKLAQEDPLGRQLQDIEGAAGMRPRRQTRAKRAHESATSEVTPGAAPAESTAPDDALFSLLNSALGRNVRPE